MPPKHLLISEVTSKQPRTQALLPTPGAPAKTLAGAGHVNTNIFGGKLKIT